MTDGGDKVESLQDAKRRARADLPANPGFKPYRLDIIDPGQWQGKEPPPRPWLVPGLIPREEVTLLYGVGGAGKSILALQLMVAAALNRPWIGQHVEQCKCLYYSCEDNSNEIWRRLAKILPTYGAEPADISGVVGVIDRAREPDNALMANGPSESGYGRGPFEVTSMYHSLYREAVDFGAGLIVVDSLYNSFGGYENARAEVNAFLNSLARMALDLNGGEGGAIVVLAHPSRTGREEGEGGSTAWSDAVRARLQFRKPESIDDEDDTDARELICRKMNFGPDGGVLRLRWNDGCFLPEDSQGVGFVDSLDRSLKECKADAAFLAALDKLTADGRKVNKHANQQNYGPKEMKTLDMCTGFRRKDLERAMYRLLDRGEIALVTDGPASRGRTRIARAGGREEGADK